MPLSESNFIYLHMEVVAKVCFQSHLMQGVCGLKLHTVVARSSGTEEVPSEDTSTAASHEAAGQPVTDMSQETGKGDKSSGKHSSGKKRQSNQGSSAVAGNVVSADTAAKPVQADVIVGLCDVGTQAFDTEEEEQAVAAVDLSAAQLKYMVNSIKVEDFDVELEKRT